MKKATTIKDVNIIPFLDWPPLDSPVLIDDKASLPKEKETWFDQKCYQRKKKQLL